MDLSLAPEHERVRDAVRALAAEAIAPLAAAADRDHVFPRAQMQALAAGGYLAMLVPQEAGGSGLGSTAYALAVAEVARACVSTSVTMAVTNMVADAISAFGTDAQKATHIPRLASGAYAAGAFALSEPDAGSDAASLKATAARTSTGYRIQGGKCWITSGDVAGVVLVMAKTDPDAGAKGISAFLIEPPQAGFSVGQHEDKLGLRGSSTVTLHFDDVELPTSARLGPEGAGFRMAMRALDGGRIGIGSQALGVGYRALEELLQWASAEAGRARDQGIQMRIADMAAELDAARLLVLRAATRKDAGEPFSLQASMAKLYATEAANRAVQSALVAMGEDAYAGVGPAERLVRDARVTTIYEGTSEVQRIVIARHLLRGAA